MKRIVSSSDLRSPSLRIQFRTFLNWPDPLAAEKLNLVFVANLQSKDNHPLLGNLPIDLNSISFSGTLKFRVIHFSSKTSLQLRALYVNTTFSFIKINENVRRKFFLKEKLPSHALAPLFNPLWGWHLTSKVFGPWFPAYGSCLLTQTFVTNRHAGSFCRNCRGLLPGNRKGHGEDDRLGS